MLPIGLCAQLACIWETTARCPGNAHRYRDFSDTSYVDFLASAAAIAPLMETASQRRVGQTVVEGVRATTRVVKTNTNLGILLLLSPLATVRPEKELLAGLAEVLGALDVADARAVYEAIRLAAPAGMGSVDEQDIEDEPTLPLGEVMALAAGRDLVARQYANGFREVLGDGLSSLMEGLQRAGNLEEAIIFSHLTLMSRYPDSLIARKRGQVEAEQAARRAQHVLQARWPGSRAAMEALKELDTWLQAESRGRNPGTTSDLVTASLFVALRADMIQVPARVPWSR